MAATISIKPREWKRLQQPSAYAQDIREATALLQHFTRLVDQDWHNIDATSRVLLQELAYASLEPAPMSWATLWQRLRVAWRMSRLYANREWRLLLEHLTAYEALIAAILEAVEQEHPSYSQHVAEAVQASAAAEVAHEIIDNEAALSAWLRGLTF